VVRKLFIIGLIATSLFGCASTQGVLTGAEKQGVATVNRQANDSVDIVFLDRPTMQLAGLRGIFDQSKVNAPSFLTPMMESLAAAVRAGVADPKIRVLLASENIGNSPPVPKFLVTVAALKVGSGSGAVFADLQVDIRNLAGNVIWSGTTFVSGLPGRNTPQNHLEFAKSLHETMRKAGI
jgi:hypothetical protein